jgi:hypothetical protein
VDHCSNNKHLNFYIHYLCRINHPFRTVGEFSDLAMAVGLRNLERIEVWVCNIPRLHKHSTFFFSNTSYICGSTRVSLVAGQPGQGRPLVSSLVPPILRDNWGQHWDSLVLALDSEPNNLILGIVPSRPVLSLQPNTPLVSVHVLLIYLKKKNYTLFKTLHPKCQICVQTTYGPLGPFDIGRLERPPCSRTRPES